MADIKFKHFNGDISTWQNKVGSGAYDNDIVFAKSWYFDSSSNEWRNKLSIYAGKDIVGNQFMYDIVDYESFVKLQQFVNINNDNFTDSSFRNSIENYLKDSSYIASLRPAAEHISRLIDPELSNVTFDVVNSSLAVYCADAETLNDIATAKNVGYIASGSTIPEGTNVEELIKMIFTKVLGLEGAEAPTIAMSGINDSSIEVGTLLDDIVVTANFNDGYWKNEEGWKNTHSGDLSSQSYGCVALTYEFSGMASQGASSINTITINNYNVVYGNNNVTCTTTYNKSMNVPVNQKGEALILGSVNDTTHYKEQPASSVTNTTNSINGDYLYWICCTTTRGDNLTRSIIEDEEEVTIFNTGFVGAEINYNNVCNIPYNNYMTIIVPKGIELKHVEDVFGDDLTSKYVSYEVDGGVIGKDTRKIYTVYQEIAYATAGLKRKNIKLS